VIECLKIQQPVLQKLMWGLLQEMIFPISPVSQLRTVLQDLSHPCSLWLVSNPLLSIPLMLMFSQPLFSSQFSQPLFSVPSALVITSTELRITNHFVINYFNKIFCNFLFSFTYKINLDLFLHLRQNGWIQTVLLQRLWPGRGGFQNQANNEWMVDSN
jgi:hypothetical protein